MAAYTGFLSSGGSLIVMGENTSFATRNTSIAGLIAGVGGGAITVGSSANAQTVQPPFAGPGALTSIAYQAAGGTPAPGRGSFVAKAA